MESSEKPVILAQTSLSVLLCHRYLRMLQHWNRMSTAREGPSYLHFADENRIRKTLGQGCIISN